MPWDVIISDYSLQRLRHLAVTPTPFVEREEEGGGSAGGGGEDQQEDQQVTHGRAD